MSTSSLSEVQAGAAETAIDLRQLCRIVEAALLAAEQPLNLSQLGAMFAEHERPGNGDLKEALALLAEDCRNRGIELVEVASGYRLQARAELQPWLSRLWPERRRKYSRALLETLALIAYRQPITRGEIEDIRGVSISTNIIRTLLERGWVRELGQRDVPGRPALLGTTKAFLDYFSLKRLDDLPPLGELQEIDSLEPEFEFTHGGDPAPAATGGSGGEAAAADSADFRERLNDTRDPDETGPTPVSASGEPEGDSSDIDRKE